MIYKFTYLFNSLFTTAAYLVRQQPLYDEDFINKFSNDEDKKKLDTAVDKLKHTNALTQTFCLSNGEEITIAIK